MQLHREIEFLKNIKPEPNTLVLEGFQKTAHERLLARGRHAVAFTMGLGKTPVTLQALHDWVPTSCMVISTKRSLYGWLRMMRRWFPDDLEQYEVFIGQNRTHRLRLWAKMPKFVMVTPEILRRDYSYIQKEGKTGYDVIVIDEYHKFMRNRNATFAILSKLASTRLVLMTGSPSSRGAQDLWTALNLMNPRLFGSYWKFVNTFCIVHDGPFGKEIWGTQNIEALQHLIRQYFSIVLKEDIGRVKKRRSLLTCDMSPTQSKVYADLKRDMMTELSNGGYLIAPNSLTALTRIRQLLCCPQILDTSWGIGGGAEAILEDLEDLQEDERHTTIFVPFVTAIPFVVSALKERFPDSWVCHLQGGISVTTLHDTLKRWREFRGICVCSLLYAESFDMETAASCYFLGYDWDPQANYQAEDRIDRLTNTNPVIDVRYVQMNNTVDAVLEVLNEKQFQVNQLFRDPRRVSELLDGRLV